MSTKRSQVNIRLHPEERRAFEKAARSKHKKLSEWFRDLARRELEQKRNQNSRGRAMGRTKHERKRSKEPAHAVADN